MPTRLDTSSPAFAQAFDAFQNQNRDSQQDVSAVVSDILRDVQARGDAAVLELTERFDRIALTPETLAFSAAEIDAAVATVDATEREALEIAAARIRAYHEKQLPEDARWEDDIGASLGWRWSAVDAAGLYVPGGLASYPSSVLMNAIPADVAGVKNLAIAVPTPDGAINPLVLLAARLSGVSTIYKMGGAQAVGAFAFGTETVRRVDKITGPGNAFVAEAKRQVYGRVGIDMIAGPSEVLVIADADQNPDWIAMDMLSQAEHDTAAQAVLVTDSDALADAVAASIDKILPTLERAAIAGQAWAEQGAIIVTKDLDEAAEISNRLAPEHLELIVDDPEALAQKITHAGAIFMGAWTPEAIGDYIGGPNHVLPTSGSARFSSGLNVLDFMKKTTLSHMTPRALGKIGPHAERLAQSESLEAHGLSVRLRLDALNERGDA